MFRRYAHVRQNDQSDCGAACLAMLAIHFRRPVTIERMRQLAGTDRVGTNLMGLLSAAEKLGFSAKAVQGDYDALASVPLPAVAHLVNEDGLGHFVVVHRVTKRYVVVADPAGGVQQLHREKFIQQWTGYLLLAVPDSAATAVAGSEPAGPWRRLLRLLTGNRAFLIEAFCCALLMTILGLGTSFFVQHLVDSVLIQYETRLLNALGVGMLLIVLFRALFGVVRQYLLAHVSRRVDLTLIADYARHILELPMSFFETRQVGEILSRVNDAAKVREAISGTTLTLIVDGIMVILSAAVLWFYDTPLALVATLFIPLLVGSVLLHHPGVKQCSRKAMEGAARLSAQLAESVAGVETIKSLGLERDRSEESESRLVRFVQNVFAMQKLGISMSSSGMFVTGVAGIVILWYGGHRVIAGELTIGQLMFFHTLLGYMLGPLERLASVNLELQDALVAVDRLYQVMDVDKEPRATSDDLQLNELESSIELRDVTFRYGCREKVLNRVSMSIPVGRTIAIVGESGSGKSTLLKLLMRFYDPSEGSISIDGADMRDYDVESLRSQIGLVSQDPFVFSGTIRDNIALGRTDASMDEIVQAARSAGLEQFITSLPERYNTVIGERGANLSGGQRQRLAIARALLRKPAILIFDEATSHLDTRTERAIQLSLKSSLADKTVIIVAHRLSTIRHADSICVLDHGKVVESGCHDELMSRDGSYADLWRAQRGEEQLVESHRRIPTNRVNGHLRSKVQSHE